MIRYRLKPIGIPDEYLQEAREILATLGGWGPDGLYELDAEDVVDFAEMVGELSEEMGASLGIRLQFELVETESLAFMDQSDLPDQPRTRPRKVVELPPDTTEVTDAEVNGEFKKILMSEMPGYIPGDEVRHPMGFIDHLPAYVQEMIFRAMLCVRLRKDPEYLLEVNRREHDGMRTFRVIHTAGEVDPEVFRFVEDKQKYDDGRREYDTLQEAYDGVVEHMSRGSANAKLAAASKSLKRSAEKIEQMRRLLKKAQENPVRVDRD